MKVWLGSALVWVACLAVVGCSNRPKVAPVRGIVKMDGKPLPGGRVMFQPIATGEKKIVGQAALGHIQKDGTFVLTTYEEGDGAIIGSHHPVVMENRQEDAANPDHPTKPGPKIGVISLNDITFEVVEGKENEFTIELNSKSYEVRNAVPEVGL